MINGILLILKGFLIGFSLIIPGVSGGTMAMVLGVYERLISIIGDVFKKLKSNILFLVLLAIGMGLSVLLGAKLLKEAFSQFVLPTILLFSGLIVGGFPMLFKKINKKEELINPINYLFFIATILLVVIITILNKEERISPFQNIDFMTIIILFGLGFISAGTMIIPGISGSLVLMVLGYYEALLGVVDDLTNISNLGHNLLIMLPFGIGVLFGVIFFAKLISFLLKRFEVKTFFGIIGFVIASIFGIIYQSAGNINASGWVLTVQIIVGIILFIGGALLTYKLSLIEIPEKALYEKDNHPKDELEKENN